MEQRVSKGGRITYATADDPHAVYRMYDKDDNLLYIGMSWEPSVRIRTHRVRNAWARAAVRWTEEWHPNQQEAQGAERDAIKAEKPERNGTHTEYHRAISLAHLGIPLDANYHSAFRAAKAAIRATREQQIAEGRTTGKRKAEDEA